MEKQTVNAFTPGVIEPSFGIDRIFTAVLEHIYYMRPKTEGEDEDAKATRGVLAFAPAAAPYKCAVLPLDQRITRDERYITGLNVFRQQISALGLSYTSDESGATIGRRYSRNDELGIPFAITFDFDFLEDKFVTVRERDTMWQIRLPLDSVPELLRNLCCGEDNWEAATRASRTMRE
ncbi:unnamed protein product [Polarella glacialis]|uniref:Anticodon-binding domain-containing protein n=1 Tax=Polarella glacialis TaxID=89957 RepID=A0A813DZ34_POLGL|nr:unnamed protein product [Polarella glacialis]CAE8739292.1 unnamed protein product [Polarella glacialis]